VEFAGASADFFAFDDDVNTYAFFNVSGNGDRLLNIANLIIKTKPTFKVTYTDGSTRTIGWSEFYGNVVYANDRVGNPPFAWENIFVGDTGADTDNLLLADEETGDWVFYMQYVPKNYQDAAYTARFPVTLPRYEFQGLTPVKRVTGAANNIEVPYESFRSVTVLDPVGVASDASLMKSIQDRWILTAQYQRGRDRKDRVVKILADYFNDAASGSANPTFLDPKEGSDTMSGRIAVASAGASVYWRNWPLPLMYRGEILDADDTVQVDVKAVAP